jgi:hypothetical protein
MGAKLELVSRSLPAVARGILLDLRVRPTIEDDLHVLVVSKTLDEQLIERRVLSRDDE